MNDSEKASEIRRVADAKFERYARAVAEQLNRSNSPADRNPTSPSTTGWEEWKILLRDASIVSDGRLEERAKSACFRVLDQLPSDERRTLWLGTDAADRARADFFAKTHSSDLVVELFERVKDLALDEAEREASFGRGFFQRRDDLLPVVREILEILSRRGQLDSETTALLQQLKTTVDSLPEHEASETVKLTLSLSTRYEDSGGSRTYSLLVTPYAFELDLGGHEWTREAGGDAWSGPRLAIEEDGTYQESGDTEQMLQEMIDAANDRNYEISVVRE